MRSPITRVPNPRILGFLLAAAALTALLPAQQLSTSGQRDSVPGRLLVRFRPNVSSSDQASALASVGGQVQDSLSAIGLNVVSLPQAASITNAKDALKSRPEVDFAEPDWIFPADSIPNDPFYPSAWHHPVIGRM